MCRSVASAILVVGALCGCATEGDVRHELLYELGDRLARTLCNDSSPTVEPVPNLFTEGQIDRIETRRCAAGATSIYRGATTAAPEGHPLFVEVTGKHAGLPRYLEVGQAIESAVRVLGQPQERAPGALTYGLSLEGTDTATIHYRGGKITSVRWEWSVD